MKWEFEFLQETDWKPCKSIMKHLQLLPTYEYANEEPLRNLDAELVAVDVDPFDMFESNTDRVSNIESPITSESIQ